MKKLYIFCVLFIPVFSFGQSDAVSTKLHRYLRQARENLVSSPERSLVYIDSLENIASESFLNKKKASIFLIKSRANIKIGNIGEAQNFLKGLEVELLCHENELLKSNARYQQLRIKSSKNLIVLFSLFLFILLILGILLRKQYLARKRANREMARQFDEIVSKNHIIERKNREIRSHANRLNKAQNVIRKQNGKLRTHNEQLETMVEERSAELVRVMKKLSIHVDNTPLAFIELDMNGRLTRWPKQAQKMFGWEAHEALGKNVEQLGLVHEDDQAQVTKQFKKLFDGSQSRLFVKNRNYSKYNEVIHVEWNKTILYDQKNEPETVLCIANDVSSRERALIDLKQTHSELDNFIYKASHDLQGPIARMKGVINLGILEGKDAVSQKYFKMLNNVTFEMSQLLSKLQKVHDIYDHFLNLESFGLKSFISNSIQSQTNSYSDQEISYTLDMDPSINWQSDRFLLGIIVGNLLENAITHKRENDSAIKVSAQLINSGILKLVFSDNGRGIVPGTEERIFDMFYHTSSETLSNGLGLYLVKKATEKLGGGIKLVRPKNDTKFEIILPAF